MSKLLLAFMYLGGALIGIHAFGQTGDWTAAVIGIWGVLGLLLMLHEWRLHHS